MGGRKYAREIRIFNYVISNYNCRHYLGGRKYVAHENIQKYSN